MTTKSGTVLELKLVDAARRCDGNTLERLVTEGKVNLNAKDKIGCTAVHLCCKAADLSSLAMLLENGARTDIFDNSGMAPIHHAATKDYIETMSVLVSYGADVNIRNSNTRVTSLHVAVSNRNTRSIKFLLFCGADRDLVDKSGCRAELGLSTEQILNHNHVRDAFRECKMQVFGKMINSYERYEFKTAGLDIVNTNINSKQFSFFCRKKTVYHLETATRCGIASYLKEDCTEVISDVYDYLVNQVVEDVLVSVAVYTAATGFDTVYVLDSTGSKFKCTEMKQVDGKSVYYSSTMTLKAYEDTIYSFAVVMETKSDTYITTGLAQTLTSSAENGFKIHLSEKCLPKNAEVSLKVIPTSEYQQILNTDIMTSTSHFCELNVNQKNRRAITISLPLPADCRTTQESDDTRVAVYHADETTQTPSEWREIDSLWKPGTNTVTVTDAAICRGTCIVTEVVQKKECDTLGTIKQFINWLYDTAIRRKKHVRFFALTKYCSGENYRLVVGLSDAKSLETNIKYWEKENYIGECSQRTSEFLAKPGTEFTACSNVVGGGSIGKALLVYQRNKMSYGDVIVIGKEHDFLHVEILKLLTGHVEREGETNKDYLTKINVELLSRKQGDIAPTTRLQFNDYPDNRVLSWLAQEIGHEWMMLGTYLGLTFSYLESIEKNNTPTRTNLTMLYTWRIDQDVKDDLGLTLLLRSLSVTHRKDLVTKINKDVQQLLSTKPKERICQWIKKLSLHEDKPDTAGFDDVDGALHATCEVKRDQLLCISCLVDPEQVVDPLSERFLVHIATMMGSNLQLILQLGLPQSVITEVRHTVREPTSAMFKCLVLAQRRYTDVVEFFKDIMECLSMQQNLHAATLIREECRYWFGTHRSPVDKQMRLLELVMEKH